MQHFKLAIFDLNFPVCIVLLFSGYPIFTMPIISYYHPIGGAKPATGGKCSYKCKKRKICRVYFGANGALSGRGYCKRRSKNWRCFDTPRFCSDCNERCKTHWGTNFSELVGSEISGSQEETTLPLPPRTTIRPGN